MIDLEAIFGCGIDPVATAPEATAADVWVRRPDCTGRMGWESPDLPEWQRWWAHCTFDDLPEVPDGFLFGKIDETTAEVRPGCVSRGSGDTKYLLGMRP